MSTREITITLNELIGSLGSNGQPGPLEKLLAAKLPAGLSFRLSMLAGEIQTPARHYNEARTALLKEWGKPSEGGQFYTFENGSREKFVEAEAELLKETVTLKVPALKVADLGEREILAAADFYSLRWLFTEE